MGPNAVIGTVKGAAAAQASSAAVATSGSVPSKSSRRTKDWSKKAKNHEEAMKSVGKMGGCCGALAYMVFAFMREVIFTIFWQKKPHIGVCQELKDCIKAVSNVYVHFHCDSCCR